MSDQKAIGEQFPEGQIVFGHNENYGLWFATPQDRIIAKPCVLSSVLRYHACTCLRCVSGSLFASACGVNSEVFAWPVKRSSCGVRSSNPPQRLYVGNLPYNIRERDIEDLFLKFGRIHSLDLKTPHRGAPFAFIEFDRACACLMW